MEYFFIIVLGALVAALWNRLTEVERRLGDLEVARHDAFVERYTYDEADLPAEDLTDEPLPGEAVARTSRPITSEETVQAELAEWELAEPEPTEEFSPVKPGREGFQLPTFDFEDVFGRRLPIWAGGIALAVAGVFLVLYSIENGLMTPPVRVALSFVFGNVLLVGAEVSHRMADRVKDPRVGQALAGAGLATLYAAFYLAGARYGLIGPAVSFGGLALVTALAIGLTWRFGLPTAVLGLLGGFATPLLVASEEANVPILAFYLALLTAGLAVTGKRIGQPWLGFAALLGGFGWGAAMLLGFPVEQGDIVAVGVYLLVLGAFVPAILPLQGKWLWPRLVAGALGSIQLAVLVALAGFNLLTWGLYLLLAGALAVLGWRESRLRESAMIAAAVAILLLVSWPDPAGGEFALIAAGLVAIFLAVPLALVWRDQAREVDLLQLVLGAPLIGLAASIQFEPFTSQATHTILATASALLALVPALAALRLWRGGALADWLPAPVASAALLACFACQFALPFWARPVGGAAVALALIWLVHLRRDAMLAGLAWAGSLFALAWLLGTDRLIGETAMLFGIASREPDVMRAILRWLVSSLPFAALALVEWRRRPRSVAEVMGTLVAYGLVAQIVPPQILPLIPAAAAAVAAFTLASRSGVWKAALFVAAAWALLPLFDWWTAGGRALAAMPMLVGDIPGPWEAMRRVLPLAAACLFIAWYRDGRSRAWLLLAAGVAATVTLHVVFKQVFRLDSDAAFVARGMAERTVWEALLVLGGLVLTRVARRTAIRTIGHAAIALGLLHFAWFTFILHNPLWAEQAVGPTLLIDRLVPAYGIAGLAVHFLWRRAGEEEAYGIALTRRVAAMVLIGFFALSELRHAFAGTILTSPPLSQAEDLLRSLLGIVLALAFLAWGSRTDQRSWRIGSLVLMLIAVLKVFLVDAAGLEGLLRIASFLALGFSLIGIGWVYSRQLRSRAPDMAMT